MLSYIFVSCFLRNMMYNVSIFAAQKEAAGMQKLLLLEDDTSLIDGLTYSMRKNGFDIKVARSLKEAEKLLEENGSFDLLLFDVSLPDDCGGDDYVTKPFKLGELCSRIRALLRRSSVQNTGDNILRSGNLSVNLEEGRVFLDGKPVEFTAAEYRLLCLLLKNGGKVLTRGKILDRLWDGAGNFVDDNTLSVYVRRLREKLEENPSKPEHLKTVRGFGYRWEE